ncbi:hypothetical protein F2Q68_00021860 [Brassica cretica]|uniref:CMP/dCMP-type deaminase domain-containing protein n=1 Tax=Brassica cretica TaxID=69181 RepID=A0A8S9FM74_BRACR|nr:hypothetical protein F2Q68_00021860 [Brassica cretica]
MEVTVFDSLGLQAKLALEALEVPVGSFVIILFREATRHVEMEAIDELIGQWQKDKLSPSQVAEKFSKCVLYVTCEPCIMCASTLSFLGMIP